MIVLSLFDGMSCGQIALKELGCAVKYYASEIDKYAIKQTQLNFPNTIQLGDVNNWMGWNLDWSSIDLVLAGSPCQGFSFAGKQLAFDDPRSKLFFVFVEILNHIKKFNQDVKFLLENVNMKKSHLRVISEYVGLFPVNINSNLVSAQNRDRWYWTNIRTKKVGLFDELYVDIPQPKDRGILLKDILEPEVDEKYFLSETMQKWLLKHDNKSKDNGNVFSLNLKGGNEKGGCLSSGQYKQNLSADFICCSMVGRKLDENGIRKDNDPNINPEQRLEPNLNGKTNCLTSVQKDNLVMTKNYAQWDASGKGYKSQQDRAFYEDGKMGCVPSARTENKINVLTGTRIRRLTPTECARLQTIPEWYKWECSDTQIYRMCGNGWTVEVIKHILSYLSIFGKYYEESKQYNTSMPIMMAKCRIETFK